MKNLILKFLIILCWMLCATIILFASLKSQLVLAENQKEIVGKIFPQGWGFFTKDPQSFALNIYSCKNNKFTKVNILNQSLKNNFGFSRASRMVGYELSMVAQKIKTNEWVSDQSKNIYNSIKNRTIIIHSDYNYSYLSKGIYVLELYKPIPYAWADQNQAKNNPISTAKILIK